MKPKFPLIPVALAVALAITAGIAARSMRRAEGYEARLREVYDGAVLSALRQLEDMELSLSKALLSDPGAESEYLGRVCAGAAQVQRSLSLLPLSHTATRGAVKFANQATDYAEALLRAGDVTEADADRLSALIAACQGCAGALYGARGDLSHQAVSGREAFYPAGDDPSFDSAVSYPVLIYDGPFSDARETGVPRALGTREISREEAADVARAFVGSDRVLSVEQGADMGGDIPCYGVTLRLRDGALRAAVTRRGGQVLWMAPEQADFPVETTIEECREAARRFLRDRGFPDMEPTYFQAYQGVAVISFAAEEGGVLLYPDLIKVQLRQDAAQVVGLEARNYLMNHGPRENLTPALTEDQAAAFVSPRLAWEAARLCLIPTDGGEKLCYEFRGAYQGDVYLAYINARTGRQEQLLKVVEGAAGLKAM